MNEKNIINYNNNLPNEKLKQDNQMLLSELSNYTNNNL